MKQEIYILDIQSNLFLSYVFPEIITGIVKLIKYESTSESDLWFHDLSVRQAYVMGANYID